MHGTVGDEDIVLCDCGDMVLAPQFVPQRGAQLGNSIIGNVVRLPRRRRGLQRGEHMGRHRKTRIAGFQPIHGLARGLRLHQLLADDDDLA